jgi:hypothetical protein
VLDKMLIEAEPIFGVIRGGGWEAHDGRVYVSAQRAHVRLRRDLV